jgi:hypothetical protein
MVADVERAPNLCLVLITPDRSAVRWAFEVPVPGTRLRDWSGTWTVDDVVKSGVDTYTVFCSRRDNGPLVRGKDIATDLLGRVQERVSARARRKRSFFP